MIPAFLQSLAATVRDLVRTGKAVHVNESTAQELDLLAGLPWEHAGDGGIPCALKTAKIAERCHWCRTRNRVREVLNGEPAAFLIGRMTYKGRCYDMMSWCEQARAVADKVCDAVSAHARSHWLCLLLVLLAACATTEPGPVKFGWSGDLAKPHGAECIGKTACDLYWCPTPCPDAGSTQNADGGVKE